MAGKFFMSGVTLMAGVLTTINKHFRAAERSNEHLLRAKEFLSLIRDIDYLLALDYEMRPNVTETIARLRDKYERISELQLDPPLRVIRYYEEKFKSLERGMLGSDIVARMEGGTTVSASQQQEGRGSPHQQHPHRNNTISAYQLFSDAPPAATVLDNVDMPN